MGHYVSPLHSAWHFVVLIETKLKPTYIGNSQIFRLHSAIYRLLRTLR